MAFPGGHWPIFVEACQTQQHLPRLLGFHSRRPTSHTDISLDTPQYLSDEAASVWEPRVTSSGLCSETGVLKVCTPRSQAPLQLVSC